MTVKQINKVFDDQLNKLDKELFNLTLDFDLSDWKIIRTDKYWKIIDSLQGNAKKEYTLRCVKYYLRNIKQ